MPAISDYGNGPLLVGREWRDTVGGSGMTPTAFSFLIPVFVVAVAAPFLCVFCIRRRRQATPVPARPPPKIKKPALRRAEAREKLLEVTEVSSRISNDIEDEQGKKSNVETRSVLERECAICLSTLYAPAPPEPAKLSPDTPITDAAALPASIPSSDDTTTATTTTDIPDAETILKLSICGHEFHADCLVSWFVLRKTSCPICRSVYMSKEALDQHDEEEQLALNAGMPPAVLEEGGAGQSQSPPVRNWHYFLRGRNAATREAVQTPDQSAIEMQSQAPVSGEQVPVEAANSGGTVQAEAPARSRLQRLLRRG